ncbi:MAG: pentapeptide repeat-containing protein [Chroococcidiopsidaceae cyanobacterium CP_BM_RX_35]|nr:pentapeptide repeat-containing protein [Chroococcidiopsidaceae cyanobacterium CP_BM_RX_35]
MEKTNLTDTNLEGANLRGADLEDAIRPAGIMTRT